MKPWVDTRTWALGLTLIAAVAGRAAGPGPAPAPGIAYPELLRDAALVLLKEGNARYVAGQSLHPNQGEDRRRSTSAEGQEPLATVLACSDSREPVELIFDRGVGDLFVVRVAGNVAGTSELATLEYGVGHLHTPVVVVMGHTRCGAVTAVVKGADLHGHLPKLAEKIRPAATQALAASATPDEAVPKAIEANIWQTIAEVLRQSPEIRRSARAGRVQLVGALYDLEQGSVQWLGAHPRESEWLALEEAEESHGPVVRVGTPVAGSRPGSTPRATAPASNPPPAFSFQPPG